MSWVNYLVHSIFSQLNHQLQPNYTYIMVGSCVSKNYPKAKFIVHSWSLISYAKSTYFWVSINFNLLELPAYRISNQSWATKSSRLTTPTELLSFIRHLDLFGFSHLLLLDFLLIYVCYTSLSTKNLINFDVHELFLLFHLQSLFCNCTLDKHHQQTQY